MRFMNFLCCVMVHTTDYYFFSYSSHHSPPLSHHSVVSLCAVCVFPMVFHILYALLPTGGTIVIPNADQGLVMSDACIGAAKPAMWLWKEGSKYSYMKVGFTLIVPAHTQST